MSEGGYAPYGHNPQTGTIHRQPMQKVDRQHGRVLSTRRRSSFN